MLYQPEAYEPLTAEWDEERARAGIRAIVADADAAFGGDSLWTGGIGAAVFAADCLETNSRYPVLG